MLPQVGQGALAVECRDRRRRDRGAPGRRHRRPATVARRSTAERAFLAGLGGGCDLPVRRARAPSTTSVVVLQAVLAAPDGRHVVRHVAEGTDPAERRAAQLLAELLDHGGRELLEAAGP